MTHGEGGESETLAYYERRAEEFVRDTSDADVSELLGEFAALLPVGADVLDWGCGSGRDARALAELGFRVTATDASPAMCRAARELSGVEVRCERFDELCEQAAFDGIWACASLLHVRSAELPAVLLRAWEALRAGGILYASFKLGSFEGMRNGRWFADMDEERLGGLLKPGFDIVRMWETCDVRPGRREERWLNCLARRRS